jgi:DNA recombination protein RmuC
MGFGASESFLLLGGIVALALVAGLALIVVLTLNSRFHGAQHRMKRLETERDLEMTRAREAERALSAAEARIERLQGLTLELTELRRQHELATNRLAATEADSLRRQEETKKQIEHLAETRQSMLAEVQALASQALQTSSTAFLTFANETFEKHKATFETSGVRHETEIKTLITPIAEQLTAYQERLKELEQNRGAETLSLRHQITGLQSETSRLVNALRSAPKTRGRWGEEALKNVLEMSGMSAFCDFVTEKSYAVEDGRLRPDVIIRMPGGRFLIVDAKAPLVAYLDSENAVDDAERERHLVRYASAVRDHMKRLAAKQYQEYVRENFQVTPDFVVMFIPGDNFFSAAIQRDPGLFQDGSEMNVLVVTPTTLLALAKAIAFGWRQEKVAENARQVEELGRDLYRRLAAMGDHVMGLGSALERGVRSYNAFIGSLEGSVMPQARRFTELGITKSGQGLTEIPPVRAELRGPRTDRDLRFAPDLMAPKEGEEPETEEGIEGVA